jgi:hypothetical protein
VKQPENMADFVDGLFQHAFLQQLLAERLARVTRVQARQTDDGAFPPGICLAKHEMQRVRIQIFRDDRKHDRPDRHIELPQPLQDGVAVELSSLALESPSRQWQMAANANGRAKDLCEILLQKSEDGWRWQA